MLKTSLDKVFKNYDIRGMVGDVLNEEFFYKLGMAYVTHFSPRRVMVGHDIRPTSAKMKASLIKGILESGCDVVDLGEIATEMLYFATGNYASYVDGGLVVTASHNPSNWIGCKLVGKDASAVGENTGLFSLKDIMIAEKYAAPSFTPGVLSDLDVYPQFKEFIMSFLPSTGTASGIRLVVDAGNGIGGKIFNYVFGDLDFDVTRMFFVPDGSYPHHVPDPIKEENINLLRTMMREKNGDLGISLDGDADRIFIVDKKGRKPDGIYTGVLIAKHILEKYAGGKVIHDPRAVYSVSKEISKLGGEPIICKAGHTNFKHAMHENDAVFGVEMASHYYYKDFYYADSAFISLAILLGYVMQGVDITELLDYFYETYPISGEVNFKVSQADKKIEEIKDHYKSAVNLLLEIDGISMEFDTWRFNLRKSNTEEILRLNVEGHTKDMVIQKFKELEQLLGVPKNNKAELSELN